MAPYMSERYRFDDSPNNTVGSVHVPGPVGSVNATQTPSRPNPFGNPNLGELIESTQRPSQRPAWLRQHQPARKPAQGGAK